MSRRDPERTLRLRKVVRHLLDNDQLEKGIQSKLARHFKVSRQRVHQIVQEERQRMGMMMPPGADQPAQPSPAH